MKPLVKLKDMGFANAVVTGLQPGKIAVRVRTTKGWVYEKFSDDDGQAIEAWAAKHSPE